MPVLPLVASTITLSPTELAAVLYIVDMRSLTDDIGLNDSSLTTTSALPSGTMRLRCTNWVLPMSSVMPA
jgi:hypothetical protein